MPTIRAMKAESHQYACSSRACETLINTHLPRDSLLSLLLTLKENSVQTSSPSLASAYVGVGGGCVVGVQQLDICSLESFGLCGFRSLIVRATTIERLRDAD